MTTADLIIGDALTTLRKFDDGVFDCCVTSPPYYKLRDYTVEGQLGQEKTPEEYIYNLDVILGEVYRVLKPQGTLWLNLADTYHNKELLCIPWRVAWSVRYTGWKLRQDIIWHKTNSMPESVKDRCTKAHEYIFLFFKQSPYYFDHEAILEEATGYDGRKDTYYKGGNKDMSGGAHERWRYKNLQDKGQPVNSFHLSRLEGKEYMSPVRNKRSVWTVSNKPLKEAHFATFPPDLIEPCILAGCPEGGTVLDPFNGAGTTGLVALKHSRNYVGIDLNPEYIEISRKRLGL